MFSLIRSLDGCANRRHTVAESAPSMKCILKAVIVSVTFLSVAASPILSDARKVQRTPLLTGALPYIERS